MTKEQDDESRVARSNLERHRGVAIPPEQVLISSSLLLVYGQGEAAFELVEECLRDWQGTGEPGERMLLAEKARIDALPGTRTLEHIEEAIGPAAEVIVRWPDSEEAGLCAAILQTVPRVYLQSHRDADAQLIAHPNPDREAAAISDATIAARIELYEGVINSPIMATPDHDKDKEAVVLTARLAWYQKLITTSRLPIIRQVN